MENGRETVGMETADMETTDSPPSRRTRGTVTKNPVITAAARIDAILSEFDHPTQQRILGFLAEEYGLVSE
jgi:hypothetical protein